MERPTDVEAGETVEVCGESYTPEGSGEYCKKSQKSTEGDLNLFFNEDDPKVIEKEVLGDVERSETLPGSVEVSIQSDAINFVGVASSDVSADALQLANLSIEVSDQSDLNEDGNSEIGERCLGAEMRSTIASSTDAVIPPSRYSVTECHLAAKVAYGAAEKAYKAESSCYNLMKIIDDTIVLIHKQVDKLLTRALAQIDAGETVIDLRLVDKMRVSREVLTSRGKELRTVANSATVAAINANQNGRQASDVTEEEPLQSRRTKFNNAYSSKNAAELACIVACKTALIALTTTEEVLTDL